MDQLIEEYTELCDEIVQKTQELFGLPERRTGVTLTLLQALL